VTGFSSSDEDLNGVYTPVGSIGALSHWLHTTVDERMIAISSGYWNFMEGTSPYSGNVLATARTAADKTNEVPVDDYYDTSTSGAQVDFECCSLSSSSDTASSSSSSSQDASSDQSTLIAVLAIAAGFLAVVLVAGVFCYLRSQREGSDSSKGKGNRKVASTTQHEENTKVTPESGDKSQMGDIFVRVDKDMASHGVDLIPQKEWAKGTTNSRGTLAASLPISGTACQDRAANDVASILGRAPVPELGPGGVYEGPLNPWWESGGGSGGGAGVDANGGGGGAVSSSLQVGSRVRLRNMHEEPTWNGIEGNVLDVSSRMGLLTIELPDGCTRSVRPEQCELASQRKSGKRSASTARGPASRHRGQMSSHSHFNDSLNSIPDESPVGHASNAALAAASAAAAAAAAAAGSPPSMSQGSSRGSPTPAYLARSAALAAARKDAQAHPIDKWEAAGFTGEERSNSAGGVNGSTFNSSAGFNRDTAGELRATAATTPSSAPPRQPPPQQQLQQQQQQPRNGQLPPLQQQQQHRQQQDSKPALRPITKGPEDGQRARLRDAPKITTWSDRVEVVDPNLDFARHGRSFPQGKDDLLRTVQTELHSAKARLGQAAVR